MVRLADVEGFLLQDVNFAPPEQVKALRAEAGTNPNTIGHGPS